MGSRMFPSIRISTILMHQQTCQLSLIQSETQAIAPSKLRPQSEKPAPILTSFIYVIIIKQNLAPKNCPTFKSHSTQLTHLRLAGLGIL